MAKLGGILKMSNSQKDLIIKLEDIIDISNGNILANIILNNDSSDCSIIRLNGIKLSDSDTVKYSDVSSAILSVSLDDYIITADNDKKLQLNISTADSIYEIPIYITNNTLKQYKIYDKQVLMLSSNMESFMLLRTNPKLTGNVKLVVTEDDNLYLDTFKISENSILNKQEYRHLAISANGDYPHDVYHVFKFLPATEMYGIYPDSYNPHISYHKMDDQIRNLYEYGAEYNTDKMYSENMKILAPLYIGKHIPTYFAIWRSDRLITKDNTDTNANVLKKLLNDALCIKIFDLRRSTAIGKYLHNYQEMITTYYAGSCALQFIELDNDKNSVDHRQGQNTWKGIAYDKGILTNRNETTYFATKTLNDEHPLENFDMFLLNGFSRNNLLFPNIINLEFMFNDPNAADFSMHNYFGLYLTENDFISFNQVIKNTNDNYNSLTYIDVSNNIIDLNTTPIDIIENDKFTDRIFFASTENSVTDLKAMDDFTLFVKEHAVNVPYENLVQINGKSLTFNDDELAFLSMDFTKQIQYGEHFKFIIPKYEINEDSYIPVVFEIIASNDKRLKTTDMHISQYVQTNTTVRPIDNKDDKTEIYRVAFYTQDLNDESQPATLAEQIKRLRDAINKFDNVLKVGSIGNESISIISSVKDVYFQHVMADEYNSDKVINDTLRYYNYNNVQTCEYITYINDVYKLVHMPFANNGLEETLYRYINIVKFTNTDIFKSKFIYEINEDIYDKTHTVLYPLIYTVNGYYPMTQFSNNNGDLTFNEAKFESSELTLNTTNWVSIISPYDVNKSIICSPLKVEFINSQINICSPAHLNVALMGINNIKDINVYVNNEVLENHYTSTYTEFKAGEKVKVDNSDNRIRKYITYTIVSGAINNIPTGSINSFTVLDNEIIYTNVDSDEPIYIPLNDAHEITFNEDTIIMLTSTNALDIYNYNTKVPLLNEDYYYVDSNNKATSGLVIPIVPLINCQWKSNGTYFDTESILDTDYLINDYNIEGNFIELEYTPGVNNQYIVDSLYDIINVNNHEETIYEYMLKTGNIKKYICNNNLIQTAIGYYNPYVQTLEFIFYGIKFIFKLSSNEYSNDIKLNEFNNYEIFILNDFDGSDENEIIVSKKEEFILIINHTYKSGYYYGNSNIKMYKDNLIQDIEYNWYKSPFNYELIDTAYLNGSIYVNKSAAYNITDIEYTKSFVEIDLDKYDGDFTSFNEIPSFAYFTINSSNYNTSHEQHDIYNSSIYVYNSSMFADIHQPRTYLHGYDNFIKNYTNVNIDFRLKNGYVIKANDTNPNEQIALSGSDTLNNYIDSFNSNYKMYIIENDSNIIPDPLLINDDYKPLSIQIIKPNKIKFNNGLFNPDFVNIFNFELYDPISDIINIDTLYGNTLISSIDSIKNYYSNKVLANSYDKSIGTFSNMRSKAKRSMLNPSYVYNYFVEDYRSPLSTNWDNNIYRLYQDENGYTNLQGYSLGVEDKMFFGSKVINLHNDYIELTKWDYQNNINTASFNISKFNEHSKAKTVLEISLNLTKTFYDYNFNNSVFVNNWRDVNELTRIKTYINNYINNVLYNIYNFKGNFDIILYKQYDEFVSNNNANEHFILNEKMLYDAEVDTNYKTEFKDINNEVILKITIDNYKNYKYYPIVKINKI